MNVRRLRRLRADEIETLVDDLWLPFAREMAELDDYNALQSDVREQAVAYRRERFEDDDVVTYVALEGAAIVGYASATHESSPPAFSRGDRLSVEEVYVRPSHRRQGVASELLDAVEDWGDDRGCSHAVLSVNARNDAAQAVYEERGYGVRRYKMTKSLG